MSSPSAWKPVQEDTSAWKLVQAAPAQKPPYKSDLRKVPLIGGILGYLDENFAEPGIDRAAKGAERMMSAPTTDKSRGQNIVGGASEVARGLGQAMAPPFIASGMGAPVKLATALGTGIVGQQATEKGLKVVGVPDEYANAAGDVVGVLAGSRGHEAVTGVVNAVRAAKESAGSMADVLLHPATREAVGIASPRMKHILDLAARAKKAGEAFKGDEAKPGAEPAAPGELTPGQMLAKESGADWSKLSKDDQAVLEHVARAQQSFGTRPAPAQPAAPPAVQEPPIAPPDPGAAQLTAADIRSRIMNPQPGPQSQGIIPQGAPLPGPPAPGISGDAIRAQNAEALARLQQDQAARAQGAPPAQPEAAPPTLAQQIQESVQAQPTAPAPPVPAVSPQGIPPSPSSEAAPGASRPMMEAPLEGESPVDWARKHLEDGRNPDAVSQYLQRRYRMTYAETEKVIAQAGASRPIVESPQSGYTAGGERKSPELRGAERTVANTKAKAARWIDALESSGLSADQVNQVQLGRVSDAQLKAGAEPRWDNIVDYLVEKGKLPAGETRPDSSMSDIIAGLRERELAASRAATKTPEVSSQPKTPAKSARGMSRPQQDEAYAELAKTANLPVNATRAQIMEALTKELDRPAEAAAPDAAGRYSYPHMSAQSEPMALANEVVPKLRAAKLVDDSGARTVEMMMRRAAMSESEVMDIVKDASASGPASGKAIADAYKARIEGKGHIAKALTDYRMAHMTDDFKIGGRYGKPAVEPNPMSNPRALRAAQELADAMEEGKPKAAAATAESPGPSQESDSALTAKDFAGKVSKARAMKSAAKAKKTAIAAEPSDAEVATARDKLSGLLGAKPIHMERLIESAGGDAALSALFDMELNGEVTQLPGKMFVKAAAAGKGKQ